MEECDSTPSEVLVVAVFYLVGSVISQFGNTFRGKGPSEYVSEFNLTFCVWPSSVHVWLDGSPRLSELKGQFTEITEKTNTFLILLSWHRVIHVVLVLFARFGGGDFTSGAHNVKKTAARYSGKPTGLISDRFH